MADAAVREEALHFLNAHRKMVLAVVDEEDKPNCSLVLYAADDDFNVYFGTRRAFGKYQRILNNPNVALAVPEESLDPLRVLDMQGTAVEVPEGELAETLAFFESKNPSEFYVKGAEDFTMFKITPTAVRWLDASSGELTMHDLL